MATRQFLSGGSFFSSGFGNFLFQRRWRKNICVGLAAAALFCGLNVSHAKAADLLFKSNFGNGVTLGPLYGFATYGAWRDLTGVDSETGFSWPVSGLDQNFSGVQPIAVDRVTPETMNDYITSEIRRINGPFGVPMRELSQQIKINHTVTGGDLTRRSQAPLLIRRDHRAGDITDLYISYWYRLQPDLDSKLQTVGDRHWRVLFEFKTGGYENTGNGDYRITTNVMKDLSTGKLYLRSKGDNVANGPWSRVDYWSQRNDTVPIPLDRWFKFEVYWHRSAGSDGRYWAAVDGQVITDYHGPNMGDYGLPINRIMITNPYSGGDAIVEDHITGLEIWSGFPCGDGKPCYTTADTTPPVAPGGLSATIRTGTVKIRGKNKTLAQAVLSWKVPTDNVMATAYDIYRGGVKVGSTSATTYTDTLGTQKGASYNYVVRARDPSGNLSPASNQVTVAY